MVKMIIEGNDPKKGRYKMLEEYINNEIKDIVSDAYVKLYEQTEPYYALRKFNVFNNKYQRHQLVDTGIESYIKYGDRKAEVFKRYVDMLVYRYNPMNENINQYSVRGKDDR